MKSQEIKKNEKSLVTKEMTLSNLGKNILTEVDNLQGIYPLKDEWVLGCSLKTRLADQTKEVR